MGTPKRTLILLNLRTALKTVSVANGYKTDVVEFSDGIKPPCDVPEAERPYIGWALGVDTQNHDAFDSLVWKIPILIAGYVWITDIDDWEARSAAINNFMDDLIAVTNEDPSWGDYAIGTWQSRIETNETEGECAKNDGLCFVEMEIEYERTVASS